MSLLGQIGNVAQRLLAARSAPQTSQFSGVLPPGVFPRPSASTTQRIYSQVSALPGIGGGNFRTAGYMSQYGTRKRKRTNPTNVKALRRALSRVEGFIKIEKRVDKILRKVAPRARAAARVGFVKRKR